MGLHWHSPGVATVIFEHAYEMVLDNVFLHLGDAVDNVDVFLKMEGLNPAGSVKLKTAVAMVEDAERRGLLRTGSRLIESSSGSLGIALAMVAAAKGYTFTCVTDPNTSPHSLDVMRALGAETVEVDWRDASGGFLGSRISYIEERVAADPGLVWLNQYANPANSTVHDRCTAAAITAEVPSVDYLFVGVGSSGTAMGCVSHFRRMSPATRIVAVDAVGSVSFGTSLPGPRFIPGIGASRVPELFEPGLFDELASVAEADAVRACRWMARTRGLFAGGSTGAVMAAVLQRAPGLPAGSRVVAISPDLCDRYARTVYDDAWVAQTFGPQPPTAPAAGEPGLTTARR